MNRRIYIAGPMSGLPDYNYPAFNEAAETLRSEGFAVENPAENPPQDTWQDYLRVAIRQMLTCDELVMLPGWHESRGATLESILLSNLICPGENGNDRSNRPRERHSANGRRQRISSTPAAGVEGAGCE